MDLLLSLVALVLLAIVAIFIFAPRPRLDPAAPKTHVPPDLSPEQLASWLADHENGHDGIIGGAEATIAWADGPQVQPLCLLYIHGFSATRQETAPVTDRIAEQLGANVVYARLAGHGLDQNIMEAAAEDWLQSVTDSWEIASRLGHQVVIIAVSTGAPLTVWLNHHVADRDRIHSFIFMSPNFRIRNPFGFLLTWPWAPHWITSVIGKEHIWEPENELAGRYWSNRYSTLAVVEMQKIVDWVGKEPDSRNVPLATIYMNGDPTINHDTAIEFHERWQAETKKLIPVTVDPDNPQHVFVGDITAPHRNDWCVDACVGFLNSVPTPSVGSASVGSE